ncbi:FAD-dependent monooxygenase [Dactylosporangium sp. AC04546]|uniref:NAD(P)/FAD-dependent oxidoreductase n=1 Tax=Dactylosporangium sp. AC04546 TaxID=2862460 RepID=UPI001EE10851|nr:FAD-dependent monooxygenase [Dactylosporangium sp. AC04546]WVK81281.1 FAD-dependent monooxygenase [Dactylosporangium sp. AC04546]
MNTRSDVVIVGARAAGAATALLLARLGHDVVVLDRAVFPADTLSTHQIARTGVVQLHRWGLLDAVLGTGAPAIRRVSFTAGGETVTRAVKDKAGVDLLVAPRRQVLDTLLAEAAARAGARIRFGVTATGLRRDGTGRVVAVTGHDGRGDPVRYDGRFVVGADGLRSMVAREAGAAVVEEHAAGGAAQYAYYDGVPWDGIELIIADRALTGVFPTHDGAACVWICGPSGDAHRARRARPTRAEAFTAYLRRTAPELARRLEHGRRVSPVTGMLRTPNVRRAAHGPGWALVGDAAYHRDAVTGLGISDAYRDAELLAAALDAALRGTTDERAALAGYRHRHELALRELFDLTLALAAYPPVPRFVELQKRLAVAIDTAAADLLTLSQ